MTRKTYRVGVIGAGAIAQALHLPGYRDAGNCEVVAVADPAEHCIAMCREKGLPLGTVYADYRKMIKNEKLDVVSIALPNRFHKDAAVRAARAGCTIFLEKPVALSMAEAHAIETAVAENGVRLLVGFHHRFNPLNVAAKKAIAAGDIGRPHMIRIRFVHGGPEPGWAKTLWFYNPKLAGGGATHDMGSHAFDLAAWYMGPVTAVQAATRTLVKDIAVDDSCAALLDFGGTCNGFIEAAWTARSGFMGVEIIGDKGSIVADYGNNTTRMMAGVSRPDGTMDMKETVLCENPSIGGWGAEMAYFTQNLGSGKAFSPGLDAGIASLKVTLACYRSSRTGRRVAIA